MTAESEPALPEPAFRPFTDEATVETIGGLSIENGTRAIAVHGSLDLTRDRRGRDRAHRLKAVLDAIVASLDRDDLPETMAEAAPPTRRVTNPFA